MAKDTRDKILDTAARLLQQKGYRGTGLNEIIAESGAPRGSIYFHFPDGKDEIVREAMLREVRRISRLLIDMLRESNDPVTVVRDYVMGAAHELESSNYLFGCPVAPIVLDSPDVDSALAEACREALDEWCTLYRDALTAEGIDTNRADALATMVVSSIEGGLLLARARRNTEPMTQIADELQRMIRDALAEVA